ncbi:MAG: serine/threonine protein kinase, partial [Planctomycetes bacterium]|nr:serine/threonine protein kinase [Planctomycetota bacterium]
MGVTYRAWSEAHGREVALKLCAPGLATAEECARLVREGRLLAEVDHPFVVGALDAGEHLGVPYLVMELVEGETLAERLRSGGPFTPQAGARLVRQIAEGVGELHRRGIVHRDLKPENVLLDRRGSPRVCDLGVARGEALSRLTETGAVLGTPAFLAPEQARGEAVGPPADVYALGVLLFVVLTGSPPFTGSLPQVLEAQASAAPPGLLSRCPLASRELAAVVACCLEKDPADRYRTADELAAALAPLAHGARSSGATRWALAGSLCAAAAGVVGVFVALHGRAPRPPQAAPEA